MLIIHEPNAKRTNTNESIKRRTSEQHQRNGLGVKYTKAASIIRLSRCSTLFDRPGRKSGDRRQRQQQPQTY
jgi:hypothetical protein